VHPALTDRLTCPRCGPDFGLILRADELRGGRVVEGVFGCPNCRDVFEVHDGFGDLRAPPRRVEPPALAGSAGWTGGSDGAGMRVVALLGIPEGPGTIVLAGEPAGYARELVSLVDGVHVVALDPALRDWPDVDDVSRVMAAPGIPLRSRSMRGVAVDGRLGERMWREAARVLAPGGRVVVVHASDDTPAVLGWEGLEMLAEDEATVVAARQ